MYMVRSYEASLTGTGAFSLGVAPTSFSGALTNKDSPNLHARKYRTEQTTKRELKAFMELPTPIARTGYMTVTAAATSHQANPENEAKAWWSDQTGGFWYSSGHWHGSKKTVRANPAATVIQDTISSIQFR